MKVAEVIGAIKQIEADAKARVGEPIGLKRDTGEPLNDVNISDGFGIKIAANIMTIVYHSPVPMATFSQDKEQVKSNFTDQINKIEKHFKKRYKSDTGSALSLEKLGDPEMLVQWSNPHRAWVVVQQRYKIGSMPDEVSNETEEAKKQKKTFEDLVKENVSNWKQKRVEKFLSSDE